MSRTCNINAVRLIVDLSGRDKVISSCWISCLFFC